uniref:Uncharacterized protein n=1 Tax=Arundo donax TaxID=35708 RepID=A0A0A9A3I5_ARUDO
MSINQSSMFMEPQGTNSASNTMASKSCCHSERGEFSMFPFKTKLIYSYFKLYNNGFSH